MSMSLVIITTVD